MLPRRATRWAVVAIMFASIASLSLYRYNLSCDPVLFNRRVRTQIAIGGTLSSARERASRLGFVERNDLSADVFYYQSAAKGEWQTTTNNRLVIYGRQKTWAFGLKKTVWLIALAADNAGLVTNVYCQCQENFRPTW